MNTAERKSHFKVLGMHCASCAQQIQLALETVAGVVEARVSLDAAQADVTHLESVSVKTLQEAARSVGDYQLAPAPNELDRAGGDDGVSPTAVTPRESLYPLMLIIGFIAGVTLLVATRSRSFTVVDVMNNFMAGFFIVFGFFKLLDLPGFVRTFGTYDLLAKSARSWGWVYPFVELTLGALYLLRLAPLATNTVTLALMSLGAIGVGRALANKQRIRCACLGTALNLPMTTVTLVEDLAMAAMAGIMLVL